jgi:hypothetical protein
MGRCTLRRSVSGSTTLGISKRKALAELDAILEKDEETAPNQGRSLEVAELETACIAAIRRIAPPGSPYRERAERIWEEHGGVGVNELRYGSLKVRYTMITQVLVGQVAALRSAVDGGYLSEVSEFVDARTFGSMLELAEQILGLGPKYKDPAAVVVGVVLEEHLRKLAAKNGIEVLDGEAKRLKADALNSGLLRARVYGQLDQKVVTGWLQLRNDAAHADWDKFTFEQVELMLPGVREFIARFPA